MNSTVSAAVHNGLCHYMPVRVSCSGVNSALAQASLHQLYKSRARKTLSPCMLIIVAYFRE